ncbi:MAG: adenosylmethionine--8-amino-7-oxononanoate transaminase [Pseudomonadota bacterium]
MSNFDKNHIWHPYTSLLNPLPCYQVNSASGVRLTLADGRELIDGMSSWWSAVHGYNHPMLNDAAKRQLDRMSHVMFGGITHEPAIELAQKLVALTPSTLEKVFFCDSGSVAVEVAMKMALQYFVAQGQPKTKFLTVRGGYHGDTLGAMSVCDPVTGMHSLFKDYLPQHHFIQKPPPGYSRPPQPQDFDEVNALLEKVGHEIAGLIIEPVVQGTGGMNFYAPQWLEMLVKCVRGHDKLVIFDEIATGFGRTGEWFATDHLTVEPDIICLGKAITGGYLSFASTLCSRKVSEGIAADGEGVLMHGPTYMANPLACSVANASLSLLEQGCWKNQVKNIEALLLKELMPCQVFKVVKDVRVLGAIGVVELHEPVDVAHSQAFFIKKGAWIRPFGKLIYIMPPFIINDEDLSLLCQAISDYVEMQSKMSG